MNRADLIGESQSVRADYLTHQNRGGGDSELVIHRARPDLYTSDDARHQNHHSFSIHIPHKYHMRFYCWRPPNMTTTDLNLLRDYIKGAQSIHRTGAGLVYHVDHKKYVSAKYLSEHAIFIHTFIR